MQNFNLISTLMTVFLFHAYCVWHWISRISFHHSLAHFSLSFSPVAILTPKFTREGGRAAGDEDKLKKVDITDVHDDVIKWKHFPRFWPFVRGIHWSSVDSSHKGQWRGALMFSLICALIKRLRKQSRGCWLETLSHSLWCHYNVLSLSRFFSIKSFKWKMCKYHTTITMNS